VQETTAFYQKVGLIQSKDQSHLLFKGYEYFELYLNQVDKICREEAFGRLAISCADEDVQKVYEESGAFVWKKPAVL
jgi:uncharacterized protein VirK/YbjX